MIALQISDCLLTLKLSGAGHLPNIHPIPSRASGTNRIVAPVSTVLFVPKNHDPKKDTSSLVPKQSNLPSDKHWTDVAPPGSIVVLQMYQPAGHEPIIAGLLGDIVATRYKQRGVSGAVIDGRSRDVVGCGKLCEDGKFVVFTKDLTSVGTSIQAKPWAVDVSPPFR